MLLQSSKVITAGENPDGFFGFGNVLPKQTPLGCFTLNCTTMKYGSQYKYVFTGVLPAVYFSSGDNWISRSLQLLTEGK